MTIFVLAIGLLGVAALMPVGSYQMQRGQIAQRVSEIGPAALDLLEASDMHNPSRWGLKTDRPRFDDISEHGSNNEWVRNAHHSSDGAAPSSVPSESNYLIEYLRSNGSTNLGTYKQANSATYASGDVVVARRCEPFAIDPLYIYRDPAAEDFTDFVPLDAMPRITVSSVESQAAAEAIFQNEEDLTLNRDIDEDGTEDEIDSWQRAAITDGSGNSIKAKSEGNYSWLATFSPGETATGSDPKQWTVSVAVFYKRPLGLGTESQWTVPFSTSGGNNGYTTVRCHGTNGEDDPVDATLIFDAASTTGTFDQDAGDTMRIKRRMWGLVTFTDNGHKRARWYRVGTVQKPTSATGNSIKIRLIGPDLPSGISAKITFFEGIEGVFTRAMRAEELPVAQAP